MTGLHATSHGELPAYLLDDAAATETFRRADLDVATAHPDYVRHKPGETTVISYLFTTSAGVHERGYAHWCADSARADEIERKARTLRLTTSSMGTSTVRIDRNTILYPFPNDARLRRLRWFTTPRKLKRTMGELAPVGARFSGSRSTTRILRYKPERRVVVAADLATGDGEVRRVLIRYATTRQADLLASTAHDLRRHGVDTPLPLLQLEDDRVSVDEFIDGTELRTVIRERTADVASVGAAISAFHSARAMAPERTAAHDLAAACSGLEGLESWDAQGRSGSNPDDCGELGELTAAVRRELTRTVPVDRGDHVLIHGDLHDKNMLITPAGATSFVDLERVARGPAAIDLGRLRGISRGTTVRQPGWSPNAIDDIDAVVDQYRTHCPTRIDDHELAWHTATALVDQALLVARHLEPGWRSNATTLLRATVNELAQLRST